jgi:predicted RNA-binding protein with PIN domain
MNKGTKGVGGTIMRWLVDGMNVIGSRPDGWWRDRPAAMRRLAVSLQEFAVASEEPLTVVFDGRPFDLSFQGIEVAFAARRGRNAADDEIAARVEKDESPHTLTVVTSDRELIERVSAAGARHMTAGAFRRLLENPPA